MQPDDDAPAKLLWDSSKKWLTLERLLHSHIQTKRDAEELIASLFGDPMSLPSDDRQARVGNSEAGDGSLEEGEREKFADEYVGKGKRSGFDITDDPIFRRQQSLKEMERCSIQIQDELIKPTANLLDMV